MGRKQLWVFDRPPLRDWLTWLVAATVIAVTVVNLVHDVDVSAFFAAVSAGVLVAIVVGSVREYRRARRAA